MALQVDTDHVVPVGLLHVEAHLVPEDAGVVDQDVQAAEGVDGLVDQRLGPLPGADVGGVDRRVAAAGLDQLDDLLGGVLVAPLALQGGADVVDDHLGALGGQQQGLLPSDTPTRAGDDGYLAVEQSHGWPPVPDPGAVRLRRSLIGAPVRSPCRREGAVERGRTPADTARGRWFTTTAPRNPGSIAETHHSRQGSRRGGSPGPRRGGRWEPLRGAGPARGDGRFGRRSTVEEGA